MSLREKLLQAVRTWLKTALDLTDDEVLPDARHGDKGVRPAPPFLTVRVMVPAIQTAADEHRYGLVDADDPTSAPTHYVSGPREATVSIQGFGDAASDWLIDAHQALMSSSVQVELEAAGFCIPANRAGPIQDISALLGTRFEARFSRDYTITYRLDSAPIAQVALAEAELALTIHHTDSASDDPDPLTITAILPA